MRRGLLSAGRRWIRDAVAPAALDRAGVAAQGCPRAQADLPLPAAGRPEPRAVCGAPAARACTDRAPPSPGDAALRRERRRSRRGVRLPADRLDRGIVVRFARGLARAPLRLGRGARDRRSRRPGFPRGGRGPRVHRARAACRRLARAARPPLARREDGCRTAPARRHGARGLRRTLARSSRPARPRPAPRPAALRDQRSGFPAFPRRSGL